MVIHMLMQDVYCAVCQSLSSHHLWRSCEAKCGMALAVITVPPTIAIEIERLVYIEV